MSADEKAMQSHALEIRMKATSFLLVANNDQNRSDWISALGRAIVKSGAMYTDELNQQ
jgi:hypothetical protein